MADRRQIEAMVKKKEQEIQQLEAQLKEAGIYLQALQDVLKRFPRGAAIDTGAATTLRPGSMMARAKDAILRAGTPLHVEQILKDQGKELTRENRTALAGSLSAYVRKGIIFTRVAPNTFGLVDLEKASDRGEPPADFAIDETFQNTDEDPTPF